MTVIAITGLGVVSPLGDDAPSFWRAVTEARCGLTPLTRLPTPALARYVAGQLDEPPAAHATALDPSGPLALRAARQAWSQSNLDDLPPHRIAVVLGTTAAGMTPRSRYEREQHAPARLPASCHAREAVRHVADGLGAKGPRLTISTACTSSTTAIAHAMQLLHAGHADVVLAGGVDVIVEELAAGFRAIGAMSEAPCDPFGRSCGMNLGEGAGFVALERAHHARLRRVEVIASLTGFALAADAYHVTSPDPSGAGAILAIERALSNAGLAPDDVDVFDAHGTATEANDACERAALDAVFGARAPQLHVTAFKRLFGHALGAAGVLELIALVPTLDQRQPCHAVSHAAGFGGSYAALTITTDAPIPADAPYHEEAVVVLGWRSLLPAVGTEIGEADPLETAVDARPPRRADRLTHLLFASVGGALDHAGLDPRAHAPDRIGLFVGTGQLPDGPAASFWRCALERGFDRASGPAFARMVLNAPAGAVGRSLELRGPLTVVADGEGAGLSAAVLAFDWLRRRDDADVLIVASAFEVGRIVRDGPTSSGTHEASAAVVFARSSWAEAAGVAPRLRVVDASLTGAGPRTSRDRPRHDAADLVALVDACHRADRDRVVAHSSSFGDVGTRATLSLAPHAPLPLTTSRPHAKATLHG